MTGALQARTREAVLQIAQWQLGVQESPAGSNRVKYAEEYAQICEKLHSLQQAGTLQTGLSDKAFLQKDYSAEATEIRRERDLMEKAVLTEARKAFLHHRTNFQK